jgi:8-amino-3,8-dideoxy-alpha-D-manno-octulosonate transaminase
VRLLEDCAQCVGGRYRGKPVGSFGDAAIFSFQVNKTITAGEGGAVVSNDPVIFERAVRFHDVATLRDPYRGALGGGVLGRFTAANFRMSEFTGAVLRAQLRKLERICAGLRTGAKTIREGIADLKGLKLRKTPDPEGDLGVGVFLDLGSEERRGRFLEAMAAENVPASGPGGSAILPVEPYIRDKQTVCPGWPSFTTPQGKAIRYGPEACPKTLDILSRHAGVILDPKFTREDLNDEVLAIRKVCQALG